jgi:hypothetical protein
MEMLDRNSGAYDVDPIEYLLLATKSRQERQGIHGLTLDETAAEAGASLRSFRGRTLADSAHRSTATPVSSRSRYSANSCTSLTRCWGV